jgi:tetratricopeptide (TPR) repeat protein
MRNTLLALLLAAACGGSSKPAANTPKGSAAGSGDSQSMQGGPTPDMPAGGGDIAAAGGGAGTGPGNAAPPGAGGGPAAPSGPPIIFPNQDVDPATVKTQVDQQLIIARAALSGPTPDGDSALRAARQALQLDPASLDAAAMVAFAYYHKKQFDTAELILDDVFKRPAAKENAQVMYVYGLVYDKTNRPEAAVLAFQKAVALDPKLQGAQVDLGVHQLLNKQYAEAQATFEKLSQGGRNDAVTLTSLASAYRGRSGEYPPGSSERNQYIQQAEGAYKKALAVDPNYGPAYYNTALLYLDNDPFPSGGAAMDTKQRLAAAKTYLEMYQKAPGFDPKLVDQRMKEVDKAIKRAEKEAKKKAKEKAKEEKEKAKDDKGGAPAGGNP